ncbi:C-5 cytosine-specific DNA methylase [Boothiomyces macroporosus]|uniref:C-5 cytosine-specific DNA methylase n=1 Tax=Boothiomyces macroporosus TaxID=261099 RepID=A0AAD5UBL0_9FUNG|nr:C-5 cytosine-specific DNA methylase [Boothiomyces macroporosus]
MLTVLDFYSGIGGFHFALQQLGIEYKVLQAFDMNLNANHVYKLNFPQVHINHLNIGFLKSAVLDDYNADLWVMSPPCQPYSRKGLRNGSKDARADSFLTILELLSNMEKKPRKIIIENVLGFENSDTFEILDKTARECGYIWQCYQLNSLDYGYPYSRPRMFVLLSLSNFNNCENDYKVSLEIPGFTKREPNRIESYLVHDEIIPVAREDLWKAGLYFDYVDSSSTRSCCFTKGYGQFAKGGGSVLAVNTNFYDQIVKEYKDIRDRMKGKEKWWEELGECPFERMQPRYFSPREIANLHGLKNSFRMDGITTKMAFKLLGNSMHIDVVHSCLRYLLHDLI